MKKKIIILCILLTLIFLILFVIKASNMILKQIYPLKYANYVEKYAKENNLDVMLVYAIIKAESNFEPNITSTSGAMGLMQIMENTAKEIAEKKGIELLTKEVIYQPELNIMLGTTYFAQLLKNYDGNIILSLAAYNAGIGNVTNWIENGIIQADGSDIENIPFKETNNYVRKILRDDRIYRKLYEE